MNKKIYIGQQDKQSFINYYNKDFCKKFNTKKIDNEVLSKIFDYALTKGTWRDFAGKSIVCGEQASCGISEIYFLDSGEKITDYNDIIRFNENEYLTNKEDFKEQIFHELACEIERITRTEMSNCYGVYKIIKKILKGGRYETIL